MNQKDCVPGTKVRYWEIVKKDGSKYDPMDSEILSEPWKLGHGEWVVNIKDKRGCVAISHLEKI